MVPETIKTAKALLLLSDEKISWQNLGKGYRIHETTSDFGGMVQRWLLVHSDQAYKREKKTLDRRIKKEAEALEKALWHLGNEIFSCETDAIKAVKLLQKKFRYHEIKAKAELVEKFSGRGRPTANSQKIRNVGAIEPDKSMCH